jgi:pilus assembly protein CpaB
MTARRRRGLLLLSIAIASGALAASQVHDRARRAAEQLGPSVAVLVATRDLPAGADITRDTVGLRRVPARFIPPDALASADGLIGAQTAVAVPAGGYLTATVFAADEGRRRSSALPRGERAVTVEVAGGAELGELATGSRVDVLVSTETPAGGGRSTMALAGVELLDVGEPGGAADDPSKGSTVLATLRVSVDQAIYLTAADNFAREIRLLPRPPGDHSRAAGSVSSGQL